jgi:hypothetical protein
MFVRDQELEPSNDFSPAVELLQKGGLIRCAPLWRGMVEITSTCELARIAKEILAKNPTAFVGDSAQLMRKFRARKQAALQPPLRIAVLGSVNVFRLREALQEELAAVLNDRTFETSEVPYGQLYQQLHTPSSELQTWRPDVSIFYDRLEDIRFLATFSGSVAR